MSRTLKLYSGEDQTPVTDLTDMIEWPEATFSQRAHLGEGSLSRIRFRDEDGRAGNSSGLPAGLSPIAINAHNVVVWQESGQTMGRMRISPKDWTRGAQVAGRAREAQISLDDYNADLHKVIVHDWERPAETDKARVQVLVAQYLSGSPRRTTNLNGSNYVSSSNTITLPATTYTRTTTNEVLASIAAASNKQYFVTVDGELFYDGNDSTAYACPFKISDRDTDLSSTVFAPQPSGYGSASSEDGQQLLSGIWLFYGDTQYVHVTNPTVANQFSWWEDIVYDDTVTDATQATVVANAILAQRQDEERQYAVKIGPLTMGQAIQIKAGQLIQIKWRAIPDADDAYVTRRISELQWTTPEPFSFFADMILDRPTKLHGQGQKIDTVIPKSAPTEQQDTPGTDLYRWSFTTNANDDATNTYDSGLFRVINGGFLSYPAADAAFGAFYAKNKAGYFISVAIPVSALTQYTFGTDILWQYDPSVRNVDIRWTDGVGTLLREDRWITGSGHALDTKYTKTATLTSPAGTTDVKFYWTSFAGTYIDNLAITTSGTVYADDPYALVDPGSSPYYARSDDPRFDLIGVGTLDWVNVLDYGATGDGSTDDTTAINSAIAALNGLGGGVLYFPAATYKCTAALTTITVPCLIRGDGSAAFDGTSPISLITCTSSTANLFTITGKLAKFENIALQNTAASPSAGAGISTQGAYLEQRVDYEGVVIRGFYINWDIQVGGQWTMHDCFGIDPVLYAVKIQNTVNNDAGDWTISDSEFSADRRAATAAVRIQSSGGGKIVNCKINMGYPVDQKFTHGIDLALSGATATGILLISNCSIENVTGDGIHVTQVGTSTYTQIIIHGNQIGLASNNSGKAISLVAEDASALSAILISSNIFRTNGTARSAVQITNCDNVTFVGNLLSLNFTSLYTNTTSTNVTEISSGVTDHGALTGLADDDHTQYILRTEAQTVGHWETIVSGTAPPVAVTNEAADDWLVGWVAG